MSEKKDPIVTSETAPSSGEEKAPVAERAPAMVGAGTASSTPFMRHEEIARGDKTTLVGSRRRGDVAIRTDEHAPTFPSEPESPEDLSGVVLSGRYRLDRVLGTGGMGKVFLGHHMTLDVPIAVKLMHRGLSSNRENVLRFSREAHATSLLQHRNVVRVLDFGEAFGLQYIVMEFLVGETLASFIDRVDGFPLLADVADILGQALSALEAAHLMGIVHRDLKPENIFLMNEPGGARVVKVVDFGLAHVEEAAGSEALTKVDSVAGTPLYMSPEQCRSLAVGPSTDLYAIGCILTELLQLDPPFSATTPMDILTKQLFMPPPPLNRPDDAEPVPPLLERLRADLLAKSPERRPQTAGEAKARLEEAMSPERSELVLPGRQGQSGFLDREARAPRWSNPAPPLDAPSEVQKPLRVHIAKLNAEVTGIDDSLRVGLMSSGTEITKKEDSADVIVLDASADVAGAEAWIRKRPTLRIIVCIDNAGSEGLGRLIAAGAADVVAYPITIESLQKRVARVLRRKR